MFTRVSKDINGERILQAARVKIVNIVQILDVYVLRNYDIHGLCVKSQGRKVYEFHVWQMVIRVGSPPEVTSVFWRTMSWSCVPPVTVNSVLLGQMRFFPGALDTVVVLGMDNKFFFYFTVLLHIHLCIQLCIIKRKKYCEVWFRVSGPNNFHDEFGWLM